MTTQNMINNGPFNDTIKQIVQTSTTAQFTTTSLTPVDITGMSVTITPSSVAHTVLIIVMCSINIQRTADSHTPGGTGVINLLRGASNIFVGNAGGGGQISSTLNANNLNDSAGTLSFPIIFLDSPATTSATTYKLQGYTFTNYTLALNTPYNITGLANEATVGSSITALELGS